MSSSPAVFNPAHATRGRGAPTEWVAVLYAMAFIAFTSTTFMGGSHTGAVLDAVWKAVLGNWHFELTGAVNEYCRKVGHFLGYGVVGLLFRNAWYKSAQAFAWVMRSRLTPFAASLSIVSTFAVACLDEWHQTFLPGRVGCLRDALLDTAGALFLNLVVWAVRARRRRQALSA